MLSVTAGALLLLTTGSLLRVDELCADDKDSLPPVLFNQVDTSQVPGVVITHRPASGGAYIGSPSIAVLPDGTYMTKLDEFGPKTTEHTSALSVVYVSKDQGVTWKECARLQNFFWANLFVHQGVPYMLGTSKHHGDIVISRSQDGGNTWSELIEGQQGWITTGGQYHTAPMPMLIKDGRIWRAFEDASNGPKWGFRYSPMLISAPIDADLLKSESWTLTPFLKGDPQWLSGKFGGWLEGNIVEAPDGKLVDILRVDVKTQPEFAAIVHLGADHKTLTFDPARDFIEFPGGCKKFTIRFDPVTKQYWTLSNLVAPNEKVVGPGGTRNTLALCSSDDLQQWTIKSVVLHHPDRKFHAFQYVDWIFDVDDLLVCSRTAYDDGLGGAHNAHDANFLTFHRIEKFRTLKLVDSIVPLDKLGMTE
jgi:hypothetical protein